MLKEFKYKNIILILCSLILIGGCTFNDNCTSEKACMNKIESSIENDQTQKAIDYYKKYLTYSEKQNLHLLNLIANKTLEDIYNGKIEYNNKINLLIAIDMLYKRIGTPFLREKLGTKKFTKSIEENSKVSKTIAAIYLYSKDNYKYTDGIKPLLNDPQPVVRGCAAAALSNIKDTDRYIPALNKTFMNDQQIFVRYYALKGLGINDYKTYKEDILKVYNGKDFLGKIIAASVMLYNGNETGIPTLKEGLNNPNGILNLRAIEGLLLNNLLIEEDTILMYFNSNDLLKNYLSARLLAKNIKPEYRLMLEENLNNKDFYKQFSASVALLEIDDTSGLPNIITALEKKELAQRVFAANAIIKYYNKTITKDNE